MYVKDETKSTSLKNLEFIGANGKQKHPYELSEILYSLCTLKLVSKKEIESMIKKIKENNAFLCDIYSINSKSEGKVSIAAQEFYKSVITLPTLNKVYEGSLITTQISIEKQQYASGVQPMLYINIPVLEFQNKDKIVGNTSKNEKYGVLRIDDKNTDIFKDLFLFFGMCSASHHHDIIEILSVIKESI